MPRKPINQFDITPGSLTGKVVAISQDSNTNPAAAQQGMICTSYREFLDPAAVTPITLVSFSPGTKVRVFDVTLYSMNDAIAPVIGNSVTVTKISGSGAPPVVLFFVDVAAAPVAGQVTRATDTVNYDSVDPNNGDTIEISCAAWIAGGVTVRLQFEAIP